MDSRRCRADRSLSVAGCVLACLTGTIRAQQAPPDYSKVEEQTVQVADGIYALKAVGMNMGTIGVSVGSDGILLVDSQFAPPESQNHGCPGKDQRPAGSFRD